MKTRTNLLTLLFGLMILLDGISSTTCKEQAISSASACSKPSQEESKRAKSGPRSPPANTVDSLKKQTRERFTGICVMSPCDPDRAAGNVK
jgi:hypothetical protein